MLDVRLDVVRVAVAAPEAVEPQLTVLVLNGVAASVMSSSVGITRPRRRMDVTFARKLRRPTVLDPAARGPLVEVLIWP